MNQHSIIVKGENQFDTKARHQALSYLNKEAKTEELEKLVKLAKNPIMRKLL